MAIQIINSCIHYSDKFHELEEFFQCDNFQITCVTCLYIYEYSTVDRARKLWKNNFNKEIVGNPGT